MCTGTCTHAQHTRSHARTHSFTAPPTCALTHTPSRMRTLTTPTLTHTYVCNHSSHHCVASLLPCSPVCVIARLFCGPEPTFTENPQGVRQWVSALSTPRDSLPGWRASHHCTDAHTEPRERVVPQEPLGLFSWQLRVFSVSLTPRVKLATPPPQGQDHICSFCVSYVSWNSGDAQ